MATEVFKYQELLFADVVIRRAEALMATSTKVIPLDDALAKATQAITGAAKMLRKQYPRSPETED